MADHMYSRIHAPCDDEEIVITGMAGRFPNSNHVAEFRDNLYNKVMTNRYSRLNTSAPV